MRRTKTAKDGDAVVVFVAADSLQSAKPNCAVETVADYTSSSSSRTSENTRTQAASIVCSTSRAKNSTRQQQISKANTLSYQLLACFLLLTSLRTCWQALLQRRTRSSRMVDFWRGGYWVRSSTSINRTIVCRRWSKFRGRLRLFMPGSRQAPIGRERRNSGVEQLELVPTVMLACFAE